MLLLVEAPSIKALRFRFYVEAWAVGYHEVFPVWADSYEAALKAAADAIAMPWRGKPAFYPVYHRVSPEWDAVALPDRTMLRAEYERLSQAAE